MRLEGRACQTVPRAGGAGSRDARHTVQGTRPFSRASGKTASAFRLGTGPSLESAAGMRMAVTPSVTPSKCIARELDGLLTRSSSTARVSGGSDRSSGAYPRCLCGGEWFRPKGGARPVRLLIHTELADFVCTICAPSASSVQCPSNSTWLRVSRDGRSVATSKPRKRGISLSRGSDPGPTRTDNLQES